MGIFPSSLPWLEKPRAPVETATAIAASAAAARSDVAELDLAGGNGPYWLPPGRRDRTWLISERLGDATPFDAPDDNVQQALTFLGGLRGDLPPGTFVFVLSDFLVAPPDVAWVEAVAHGWDLVPVVIRDPVWEQSFPPVGGVGVPIMEPRTGHVSLVRLTGREARRRRETNEERQRRLLADLAGLGLDPRHRNERPRRDRCTFIAWLNASSDVARFATRRSLVAQSASPRPDRTPGLVHGMQPACAEVHVPSALRRTVLTRSWWSSRRSSARHESLPQMVNSAARAGPRMQDDPGDPLVVFYDQPAVCPLPGVSLERVEDAEAAHSAAPHDGAADRDATSARPC